MKRVLAGFIIVIIIAVNSASVFAADALYRMLHADEVEQFRQDQDAFIVGQLIDKKEDKFQVKVLKVVSGKMKTDTFSLSDDFQYGYGDVDFTPSVNDYCVMSLKKTGTYYKKAWGIFKATSGDYKILKLMSEDIKYSVCNSDIAAIEWYVNSEGKENDFYFEGDRAFVRKQDGQSVQIYPKETEVSLMSVSESSQISTDVSNSESKQVEAAPAVQKNASRIGTLLFAVILCACVITIILVIFRRKKPLH